MTDDHDSQTALSRFNPEETDHEATDDPDVEALVDRVEELETAVKTVAETTDAALDNLDTVIDRLEAIESPAGSDEPAETDTDPAFQ